jgi:hypothetical protein
MPQIAERGDDTVHQFARKSDLIHFWGRQLPDRDYEWRTLRRDGETSPFAV